MSELRITTSKDSIHTTDFAPDESGVPRHRRKRRRGYIGPKELDKGNGLVTGSTRAGFS